MPRGQETSAYDPCFWPIFVDFQNEVTGLCVNDSINKDME